MSMKAMAAAPVAERKELYSVVEGAASQAGISTFADLLKLLQLAMDNLPAILAAGTQIQAWIAKLVEIWKNINPTTPPTPNVP